MTRSILVVHPGSLGDVLLAVPAIERLRRKFSQRALVLIAQAEACRFLAACHVIDEWQSIDGTEISDLLTGSIREGSWLATCLQHCDGAVVWMEDEVRRIETTLRRCGVRRITIGSPFDPGITVSHQTDRFLETIGEQPITPLDHVRVPIPEDLVEMGRASLNRYGLITGRPLVMLHPGSGSPVKCVEPEVLAAAVAKLDSNGFEVVLLEGPADEEFVRGVRRFIRTPIPVLLGLNISTVAGILSLMQLYIGHDSGITHLAGLIGGRTLALFGPTDPDRWAPRGCHVKILRGLPCICPSWKEAQVCPEKPCLSIKLSEIWDVIEMIDENADSSFWDEAGHTLSPPDPCAKVAR